MGYSSSECCTIDYIVEEKCHFDSSSYSRIIQVRVFMPLIDLLLGLLLITTFIMIDRICVSVFTVENATIQIFLNEEPLFSYQPGNSNTFTSSIPPTASSESKASTLKPSSIIANQALSNNQKDGYYLKRLRHSCGEVSCLSIDEYVSLPPEANLSVRYFSQNLAQAFFSIRKM